MGREHSHQRENLCVCSCRDFCRCVVCDIDFPCLDVFIINCGNIETHHLDPGHLIFFELVFRPHSPYEYFVEYFLCLYSIFALYFNQGFIRFVPIEIQMIKMIT